MFSALLRWEYREPVGYLKGQQLSFFFFSLALHLFGVRRDFSFTCFQVKVIPIDAKWARNYFSLVLFFTLYTALLNSRGSQWTHLLSYSTAAAAAAGWARPVCRWHHHRKQLTNTFSQRWVWRHFSTLSCYCCLSQMRVHCLFRFLHAPCVMKVYECPLYRSISEDDIIVWALVASTQPQRRNSLLQCVPSWRVNERTKWDDSLIERRKMNLLDHIKRWTRDGLLHPLVHFYCGREQSTHSIYHLIHLIYRYPLFTVLEAFNPLEHIALFAGTERERERRDLDAVRTMEASFIFTSNNGDFLFNSHSLNISH